MLRNLKYIALVIGFALILATKLKYQKRIANNPDKSTPYNKEEKTMLYAGYGFLCISYSICNTLELEKDSLLESFNFFNSFLNTKFWAC